MTEQGTALIQSAGPVDTNEYKMMIHQARSAIESGLLPKGIDTWQKALTIMSRGRELGVSGMYALSVIAVINGKAVVGAELMSALIFHRHGDNAIRYKENSRERCTIRYKRRGWSDYDEYSFDLEDAKLAGLLEKDTWKKYPAAMLRARCISAVARMAFPDVLGGLYTPEEMGAEVDMDDEGTITIVENRAVRTSTGEVIEPTVANEEMKSAFVDLRDRTRETMRGEDWAPMLDTEEQSEPEEPGPVESPSTGRSQVMREGEQAPQSRYSDEKTEAARQAYPEATERVNRERERARQEADASRQRAETKPISNNDIATITKLCQVLGVEIPDDIADWSSERGKAHVKELATQYNARKQKSA